MKLKIDLTDPRHVAAAAAFFNSLAGVVPGDTLSIEPEAKPARVRKRATTAKIEAPAAEAPAAEAPAAEAPAAEAPAAEAPAAEAPAAEEGGATLEILQDLVPKLSKASKDNIPKMRDKLIELGAKRVSSLTSDNYQEFYDFLKTLDSAGA